MRSFLQICEAAKDPSGPSRRDFLRTTGAVLGSWQQVVTALASSGKAVDLVIQTVGMDDDDTFGSIGWLAEKLMKTFGLMNRTGVKDVKGGTQEGYYGPMTTLEGTLSSERLQDFIKSLGKHVRVQNNMEAVAKELKRNAEELATLKPGDPRYEYMKRYVESARKAIADGTISLDIHDFKNDVTYRIFKKTGEPDIRAGTHILNRTMEYGSPVKGVRDILKIPIDMKYPDGVHPYDWGKMSDLDKKVLAQGDPQTYGKAQKDYDRYRKEVERHEQEVAQRNADRASREEEWQKQEVERRRKEKERRKQRAREEEVKRRNQTRKDAERIGARLGGEGGMHQSYEEPDWKTFKSFLSSPDVKDIYVQKNIQKRGRPELWS